MANPNGMFTLIRRVLAECISPRPAPGTAWCLDCALNEGETLVVSSEFAQQHVEAHTSGEFVHIDIVWAMKPKDKLLPRE